MRIDTRTLTPGDEVAVARPGRGRTSYRILVVAKVGPAGRVTMNSGIQLDANGRPIGSDWRDRYHLTPVTEEIRKSVYRDDLLTRVGAMWAILHTLPTGVLEDIARVIMANTAGPKGGPSC